MVEKFNGIVYLIIFLVHFVGIGFYTFQLILGTEKFCQKFEIDPTASTMIRFVGAFFLGWILMAIYIMLIRPNGVEGTWGFFNLVFVQNICIFLVNTYSIKVNKTGIKTDSNEGVIAPLVFTILSAILIFGLSDKIYLS
tara:strand:- start:2196 stop:2612 length:417 start_codon:yes stop_codon:yes gene_type:complete